MLGFDPSMVPIRAKDGSLQYDITVHSSQGTHQVYRTIGVLFDGGSKVLLGRGTRVWEAMRLDDSGQAIGESVALKDCWVDSFREREGDITTRIRQSATTLDDEDRTKLGEMLLEIVGHGDVHVGGNPDRTQRSPTGPHICSSPSCDHPAPADDDPECDDKDQVHYRIVYAEVGQPLQDETSLLAIYKALMDACAGMCSVRKLCLIF